MTKSNEGLEWFHEALTPTECDALWAYQVLCEDKNLDWTLELEMDLNEGSSRHIEPEDFDVILDAYNKIGPRMLSEKPVFEEGDGAHIVTPDGESTPVTIVRATSREVSVVTDRVYFRSGTDRYLFVSKTDYTLKDTRVFTRRTDGSFQFRGSRNGTRLGLGRAYWGASHAVHKT